MRSTGKLLMTVAVLTVIAIPVRAQSGPDLVYQVQDLLEEVRQLRGQVEAQQREIENLQRRQRDQYLDLDQRLQALNRGTITPTRDRDDSDLPASDTPLQDRPVVMPATPPVDRPEVRAPIDAPSEVGTLTRPAQGGPRDLGTPGADEQAAYDRAFRALRETRYADAAEGFAGFLDQYPDSSYAPNAQYWMSETYYVTRDFDTALRFFNQLLSRYPGSNKQGDALLKIGFSHFELRQWNEARAALEQVRSQYPDTTLARLAEGRLRDMRLAGHY